MNHCHTVANGYTHCVTDINLWNKLYIYSVLICRLLSQKHLTVSSISSSCQINIFLFQMFRDISPFVCAFKLLNENIHIRLFFP